jgi:hypothetical protein
MTDLNLVRFKSKITIDLSGYLYRTIVLMSLTLVLSGTILSCSKIATEQEKSSITNNHKENSPKENKENLEVKKLKLEIAKLEKEAHQIPQWLSPVLGFIGINEASPMLGFIGGVAVGVIGSVTTVWASRQARLGALDQSVHQKRIDLYPKLVATTAPLALYFPPTGSIDRKQCRQIGQSMRAWYFSSGGLILSTEARDAYFQLARALTKASLVENLFVPKSADYKDISAEAVKKYKEELETILKKKLDEVENWEFGLRPLIIATVKFKDFVYLQTLSSTLRTKLTEDLRSRRKPAT